MYQLLWIFVAYWVYRIIVTAIENERITKVAKIEARLKHELSQRYADPSAVERIMEAKLHDPHALHHRVEHEVDGGRRSALMAEATDYLAEQDGDRRTRRRDGHLLGGLITFLLGLAFCASAWIVDIDPLFIPGFLLSAIGLGLLTFATSQQEMARAAGRGQPQREGS